MAARSPRTEAPDRAATCSTALAAVAYWPMLSMRVLFGSTTARYAKPL